MSPKAPSPKPMPLTSMPDRVYPPDQRDAGQELKAGIRPSNDMKINPGKPEEK
jgi:hypothetical protein